MKNETTMLTVTKVIREKGKEFSEETIRPLLMKEIEKIKDEMSERFDEFANSAINMIMLLPKEKQTGYIETAYPLNKQLLIDIIKEINSSESKTETEK